MLSKIQTDTHLSGRLLDQGTRSGRATNRVSSNLCALFEAPLQSTTLTPFTSGAKRRIFNRLQRFNSLPRCLANFLRISNFSASVNRALHFSRSKSPNPFISLRGSKEPQDHSARAKPRVNRLIRPAQKIKNIQTTIPAAEHSAPQKTHPQHASGSHQLQ